MNKHFFERTNDATSGKPGPFKQLFISHFLSTIIPLLRILKFKNMYFRTRLNPWTKNSLQGLQK